MAFFNRLRPRCAVDISPESRIAREMLYTRLVILMSVLTASITVLVLSHVIAERLRTSHQIIAGVEIFFAINIAFLMYGSVFFQVTRLAFFKRLARYRPASREELEAVYTSETAPSLAILVPSYREEVRVVRMTLMSAALSEYPDRRVVLLIDDPPNPSDPAAARQLHAMRELVRNVDTMFQDAAERFNWELVSFDERRAGERLDCFGELRNLAAQYRAVAEWLEAFARNYAVEDHYDRLFVARILREPAEKHRARAVELSGLAQGGAGGVSAERLSREYRRLASLFGARISCFERKRYINLSHAANKAMNLNSYLGLLGRNLREVVGPGGLHLEECSASLAQIRVPDAEYVITLDADSMLCGDYALRLTHIMSAPGADKYAVVESPFTAVPGSPSLLERIAGAQTDVQWFRTQGSTLFNASFWVGANALLRRAALEDICETVYERGYPVKRYIHDRTLVEDTESTIDLVVRGWKVFCCPERLSYTATPPDFGTLVIQRRRWANGPVLIVPKLLRYAISGPGRLGRLPEIILRFYTLTSVLGAGAMLLMITVPFPDVKRLPFVLLMPSVLPYYILYCRDLMSSGYDWWDLPRVHGLDLLLIPVNLTGLLKSLRQAITGHQSPFGRTPKVKGRVAAPATQILMPLAILSAIIGWSVTVMTEGGWTVGVFGLINGTCLGYALLLYIGVREGLEDIRASLRTRFEPLALGLRRLLGAPSDGPKRLPQVSREAESREAKSA